MATATILHVGGDFRLHIPVMQSAGLSVLTAECSIPAICDILAEQQSLDAIVFEADCGRPTRTVVTAVRTFSKAPLVLFRNVWVECEEKAFDLIVPPLTPPDIWLKKLEEVIAAGRELGRLSHELREESASARSTSRRLRELSARNRVSPIDPDALWRGEMAEGSGHSQPNGSAEPREEKMDTTRQDEKP